MENHVPLIVVNPAARGGAAGREWGALAVTIRAQLGPFDCAFTRAAGDGVRIAEEEARGGRRFIIAFGGDGTISETATGILRSGASAELGVLSHGTGADFVRTVGLPRRLADAARALQNGRTVPIDVGRVTYATGAQSESTRYFINTASFGMSGVVADRTNRSEKRFGGRVAFAAATVTTALSFRPPEVEIAFDGNPGQRQRIAQVAICNGRYFGGGMKIAPDARLVDGKLDLVVIDKLSFLELVSNSRRLYAGTHVNLPQVRQRRVQSVAASSLNPDEPVLLEVDGETPGRLPARFEVCPGALRLRAPV